MQKKHNGRKANIRDGDPNIQIPKADGISVIPHHGMRGNKPYIINGALLSTMKCFNN